ARACGAAASAGRGRSEASTRQSKEGFSPRSWSNSITASRQNCSLRGIANTTTNHFATGDSRALLTLFALRSELPSDLPVGAFLEVEGKRYGSGSIRRLYESSDYPLPRRAAVKVQC